ncbi:hypothetical protein HYH03_006587 [Edaphochlamys debaryana]|uniref:Uncharacterized protein n=1 Tax=Edaphochlamys debaryana TaxID=47281 RepID=A0A835Y3J9_9CHLO|nr:hypothetical protein HYH03_006587 [Edaphochlamys debaryana]|eukprot:KAG2495316.1 hypothetical protein HYH03_006587 [Edaphochlamys debaryana]
MSRRYHDYDDSDSDVDLPRSTRPRGSSRRAGDGKSRKEASRPWTQEESDKLISIVGKVQGSVDLVNWQDVAKLVPGRTGKQCREKWKNDLRPNISKDPWSLKEEYVLALAHSLHGNRWSEVARYLPTRPENTIKNRWYATNRAKAEVKVRTFLWLYADLVDRQGYPAGPDAIEKARVLYRQLPDVVPLEEFEVPVDFYMSAADGVGPAPADLDTRPEIKIIGRGKAKPHVPGATVVGGGSGHRSSSRSARSAAARAATTTAAAGGDGAASSGSHGGSGSGGGGHSEGDANCYVKVGGLAAELPVAAKLTPRKRKASGAAADGAADGGDADLDARAGGTAAAGLYRGGKILKTDPDHDGEDASGGVGGGTSLRAAQDALRAASLAGLGGGAAAASASNGGGGAGSSSSGGAALGGHAQGQQSPLDPELVWQQAADPFHHQAQRVRQAVQTRLSAGGRGGGSSSSGGGSHITAAAAASLYGSHPHMLVDGPYGFGHLQGHPHALSHLHPHHRLAAGSAGSEGGAGDVSLFGAGTLDSLLGDAPGGGGGSMGGAAVSDADAADILGLGLNDGLDIASLSALIGGHDGPGGGEAHNLDDAVAGLAADVMSLPPSDPNQPPSTPRGGDPGMSMLGGGGGMPALPAAAPPLHHVHPHTVTTLPPQLQPPHGHHHHHHPAYPHPHPHSHALAHPMRHSTSHGSALQPGGPGMGGQPHPGHPHPHSLSAGSHPLQPSQPLIQPSDSGLAPPVPTRGSVPLPPMSPSGQQDPAYGPGPGQGQPGPRGSSGSLPGPGPSRMHAAGPPPHAAMMPYGSPPYGPPPPYHPAMMQGGRPGPTRGTPPPPYGPPGGPPGKYGMPPPYPGGPPPPYMCHPMHPMQRGYYRGPPPGSRPPPGMPRGMMPYPPYGHPYGPPHGMPHGYPGPEPPPQLQAAPLSGPAALGPGAPYTPIKSQQQQSYEPIGPVISQDQSGSMSHPPSRQLFPSHSDPLAGASQPPPDGGQGGHSYAGGHDAGTPPPSGEAGAEAGQHLAYGGEGQATDMTAEGA